MLKGVLLVSFAIIVATPVVAIAEPRSLPAIALLKAPVVVAGEVIELGVGQYTLKVDDVLAGDIKAQTISVERFRDWPCAFRWSSYKTGERLLLFLERPKDAQEQTYINFSPSNEGECPLVGTDVYTHWTWGGQDVTFGDRRETFHSLPYRDFRAALVDLRRCYYLRLNKLYGDEMQPGDIRLQCSQVELQAARNKSAVHRDLVDQLERYRREVNQEPQPLERKRAVGASPRFPR